MIVPREINDNVLCDFLHHKQTFYTVIQLGSMYEDLIQ